MKYKNITLKTINLKIEKDWRSIEPNEVVDLEKPFEGLEKVKEAPKKVEKKAPKKKKSN